MLQQVDGGPTQGAVVFVSHRDKSVNRLVHFRSVWDIQRAFPDACHVEDGAVTGQRPCSLIAHAPQLPTAILGLPQFIKIF